MKKKHEQPGLKGGHRARDQTPQGLVVPSPDQFAPAPATLAEIAALAKKQMAKEDEIARVEAHLKKLNDELNVIRQDLLPSIFDQAGVKSIKLPDGSEVIVNEILAANIIAEDQPKVFAWLRANKYGALVKNEFKVALGKGQDKVAKALAAACKKLKIPVERKESVNWQTLQAFVRERMRAGKALPPEINVNRVPTAKINRPKEM